MTTERRCAKGAWSFQTGRIGRARMHASVMMFGIAFPMNDALALMQCPGTAMFHAFRTGVHWKMLTRLIAIAQLIVIKERSHAAVRKLLVSKMLL